MRPSSCLLMAALCLLAACEPLPPAPATGGAESSAGWLSTPDPDTSTPDPLQVDRTTVGFPAQVPGGAASWELITITNPNPQPVSVSATVSPTEGSVAFGVNPASLTVPAHGMREVDVSLTIAREASAGAVSGLLTLSSGMSEPLYILLRGQVIRTRVEPHLSSISFSPQVVGASPQAQRLTLRNVSSLPVTVDAATASPPGHYTVTGLPADIPAGQSHEVTVLFNPSSRGQWDATLQFSSSAADPVAAVALSGQALAPVLSFEPSEELNFGNQMLGTETLRQVSLRNTGDAAVALVDIAPDDPTHFSVRHLNPPRTLDPGGSLTFSVVFRPTALGSKQTRLRLYAGSPATALGSPELQLRGEPFTPGATFEPSDIIDFGPQRAGGPLVSRTLKLINPVGTPEGLRVERVIIRGGTPEFTLGGTYAGLQALPGEYLDLEVGFRPTLVGRRYTDTLDIVYKGIATNISRTWSIPLQGDGATALLQVDSTLDFGAVEQNQALPRVLRLTNTGQSTLRLNSIEGLTGTAFTLGQLNWPKDLAAGESEVITITFQPRDLNATTVSLVITSNATSSNVDASGRTTVRLSGRGAAAKALFRTRTVSFGEVPIGQTEVFKLLITNTGSSPLQISRPNPSASFQVRPPEGGWPRVIPILTSDPSAPNSYEFEIEFRPTSEQGVAESLTFTSNDPDEPSVAISLQGAGTRPRLRVDPRLDFGRAVPSGSGTGFAELRAYLPLRNEGRAPLVIHSLVTSAPFCFVVPGASSCTQAASNLSLTLAWEAVERLELRVLPVSENLSGTLSITTNEGGSGSLIKEVQLSVGGAGGVSVQAEPLQFGDCATPEAPPIIRAFELQNSALGADKVMGVSFSGLDGADFSAVDPPSLDIPGQGSVQVRLSFKPRRGVAGERRATAHIYTQTRNLEGKPPLALALQGCAVGEFSGFKDFQWEVDFGTQRLGEQREPRLFRLESQVGTPLFVNSFQVEGAQAGDFSVEAEEGCVRVPGTERIRIGPGEVCNLRLSYVAQEVKLSSARLKLELDVGDAEGRTATAQVKLKGERVSSILSVEPLEVDFGWVDLGQVVEPREITVTNRSSTATRVLMPEVTNADFFTVEALEPGRELPPGGVTTLRVTLHPTQGGELAGELRLRLQGEQGTDVTLGLRGQVRALGPAGGGCSSAAGGGSALLAAWLLLLVLHARRRSHSVLH